MTVTPKNLSAAISEIVEELTLMMVEAEDGPVDFPTGIVGRIGFTGPAEGELAVRCEAELGADLASNMLGVDPGDDEAQTKACDALGEMLNVICGNLVTRLFDEERPFTLSIPEVRKDGPPPAEASATPPGPSSAGATTTNCVLYMDGHPIEFTLSYHEAS